MFFISFTQQQMQITANWLLFVIKQKYQKKPILHLANKVWENYHQIFNKRNWVLGTFYYFDENLKTNHGRFTDKKTTEAI
jgi:aspartate/tyrosine/aromatic aminotransferase